MAQTNINIRIDEGLKREFDAVCNDLGLTMTAAFNVFAKTVARRKAIPFEITALDQINKATSTKTIGCLDNNIRKNLVESALEWERRYSNAPSITGALAEYDVAILCGLTENEYSDAMKWSTVVQEGFDFEFKHKRYQVKGNRPSGKPGSKVTLVAKANNDKWDYLVWILYNKEYEPQEAWLWDRDAYKKKFAEKTRLSPEDMRKGKRLFPR
jgi:addiction module RelB/DinJ family antitoxin